MIEPKLTFSDSTVSPCIEIDKRHIEAIAHEYWAANLVLKDANEGWRKERIRRCRLLYEYCMLRWQNEGCERTLFWLKWQDRWLELERYYKEIDLNGEKK